MTIDLIAGIQFQSTHPRRVWQGWVELLSTRERFQSTHPRRVWRTMFSCKNRLPDVSIHTPTKGVTRSDVLSSYRGKVSIHTPTKGVTKRNEIQTQKDVFQSTHPRRVWHGFGCNLQRYIAVSIHTPTKGVTNISEFIKHKDMFQSTHPRRVWPWLTCYSVSLMSFNPHTHEGCDCIFSK